MFLHVPKDCMVIFWVLSRYCPLQLSQITRIFFGETLKLLAVLLSFEDLLPSLTLTCFFFICRTVPLVFICDYRKCRTLPEPDILSSG